MQMFINLCVIMPYQPNHTGQVSMGKDFKCVNATCGSLTTTSVNSLTSNPKASM